MKEWGCTPINKSLIPQWGDQKRFLKRANTSEGSAPCGMRLKSLFCLYLWSQIFQLGLKENPRRHLELWNNYRCRSTSSLFILKLMPYLLWLYMCFFWVGISQVAVAARGSGGQLVNKRLTLSQQICDMPWTFAQTVMTPRGWTLQTSQD